MCKSSFQDLFHRPRRLQAPEHLGNVVLNPEIQHDRPTALHVGVPASQLHLQCQVTVFAVVKLGGECLVFEVVQGTRHQVDAACAGIVGRDPRQITNDTAGRLASQPPVHNGYGISFDNHRQLRSNASTYLDGLKFFERQQLRQFNRFSPENERIAVPAKLVAERIGLYDTTERGHAEVFDRNGQCVRIQGVIRGDVLDWQTDLDQVDCNFGGFCGQSSRRIVVGL